MTHAEWRRWRRCGRKIRHATVHDANAAVLSHWRVGDWAWRYQCDGPDGCGGWHVTTDETTRTEAA